MKKTALLLLMVLTSVSCEKSPFETSKSPENDSSQNTLSQEEEDGLLFNSIIHSTGDEVFEFKRVDGITLEAHVFYPPGYEEDDERIYPAAAWFHGGGWVEGIVQWGYEYSQYMASLGLVAISFEYRLADSEQISAMDCMIDVNSALRWMRTYHRELRIDPQRIISSGDSAGGHLAISTAMFPQFMDSAENEEISSVPNLVFALVPPVDLAYNPYFQRLLLGREQARNCSPLSNVKAGLPPMYLFIGTRDEYIPYQNLQSFEREMGNVGNEIGLDIFPEGDHSFYWRNGEGRQMVQDRMWSVLQEKGWVE